MSEYQYYEFRTINRQLTAQERTAVDRLSSHGDTTATSFSVSYNYSDFKHSEDTVLATYFDAFFYIANWGSATLKFRFPKELVDTMKWEPYCADEEHMRIDHKTVGDSVILSFEMSMEGGFEYWIEGAGMVDGLLALYQDILQGDLSALYLGWLSFIQYGADYSDVFDEDAIEPPVPLGLHRLSPALEQFVNLFEIDGDLIAAARHGSVNQPTIPQIDEKVALAQLSQDESIDFLYRLLQGEPHLELKLKQKIGLLQPHTASNETGGRTIGTLLAASEAATALRQKAAEAAQEAQRQAEMQALAQRGESAWQEVDTLIEKMNSKSYKEAAKLLRELSELADWQGESVVFAKRLEEIRGRYSRRSSLMAHLRDL